MTILIKFLAILRNGERLTTKGQIESTRGCFKVVMQDDGNLVVYRNNDNKVIWASNTKLVKRCVLSFYDKCRENNMKK